MSLPNSSTSSSEPTATSVPSRWRGDFIWVALSFCVALAGYDAVAGLIRRDPRVPSRVRTFFDHGLSIEEKHFRAVGLTSEPPSPICQMGFLEPPPHVTVYGPSSPPGGGAGVRFTVYGMSFSDSVGRAIVRLDPTSTVRSLGAPNAPPNQSLAVFRSDRARADSDVLLFGILGSSVSGVLTQCLTWCFVAPQQYTYPRYDPKPDGTLDEIWPRIRSFAQFRAALTDPAKWNRFVDQIRNDDPFYDPFLFQRNLLDRSTSACLLRTAWAQRRLRTLAGQFHSEAGFNPDSGVIRSLRAIALAFGREAREGGQLPVVLLLGDRDHDGHLDRAIGPALREAGIPFVSTHDVSPSTDPNNLLAGGHFTDAANDRLARAVLRTVGNFRRGPTTGRPIADRQ
jgi:hypothetical protein